jgi:hypothetical protein
MMDTGWAPDPQMASTDDTTVIYDTGHAFPLGFVWGFVDDIALVMFYEASRPLPRRQPASWGTGRVYFTLYPPPGKIWRGEYVDVRSVSPLMLSYVV